MVKEKDGTGRLSRTWRGCEMRMHSEVFLVAFSAVGKTKKKKKKKKIHPKQASQVPFLLQSTHRAW
jgi:hypothetical protein